MEKGKWSLNNNEIESSRRVHSWPARKPQRRLKDENTDVAAAETFWSDSLAFTGSLFFHFQLIVSRASAVVWSQGWMTRCRQTEREREFCSATRKQLKLFSIFFVFNFFSPSQLRQKIIVNDARRHGVKNRTRIQDNVQFINCCVLWAPKVTQMDSFTF